MQTFLPYPDLLKSVQCLDNKRLGKQRVEAMQILRINIQGETIAYKWEIDKNGGKYKKLLWFKPLDEGDGVINTPWYNHPAVRMWRGYETCLEVYMNCCIWEWKQRGFKNSMFYCATTFLDLIDANNFPSWFGNKDFHNSHKSNLLRKDYDYYHRYNWNVSNNLPYVWPK